MNNERTSTKWGASQQNLVPSGISIWILFLCWLRLILVCCFQVSRVVLVNVRNYPRLALSNMFGTSGDPQIVVVSCGLGYAKKGPRLIFSSLGSQGMSVNFPVHLRIGLCLPASYQIWACKRQFLKGLFLESGGSDLWISFESENEVLFREDDGYIPSSKSNTSECVPLYFLNRVRKEPLGGSSLQSAISWLGGWGGVGGANKCQSGSQEVGEWLHPKFITDTSIVWPTP